MIGRTDVQTVVCRTSFRRQEVNPIKVQHIARIPTVARQSALRAHTMSPLSVRAALENILEICANHLTFQLLFILSTSLTLISCRQTPNIRLVKTNNYFQPIRRQQSGGQPIRRQISGGYEAPSGYGAPARSAPSDYGSPVAAVVEAKGKI